MDLVLSIALGIGLAAACGFRVFVPLLVIGIAGRTEHLVLADGMQWMAEAPAILCFFIATVLEIAAYYVPWLDNLLDTIASPAAVVAGSVATASVVQDMSPFLRWTLALIAGGGVACMVQGITVGVRSASTATTAGFANFLIATLELILAFVTSIAAMLLPVVTVLSVVVILAAASRIVLARLRKKLVQAKPTPT
jgi:hypothetical protein